MALTSATGMLFRRGWRLAVLGAGGGAPFAGSMSAAEPKSMKRRVPLSSSRSRFPAAAHENEAATQDRAFWTGYACDHN